MRTSAAGTSLPSLNDREVGSTAEFIVRIVFNGQEREIEDDATVAQLLATLNLLPKHVAVEVNRDVVSRTRHSEHRLQPGDEVEVVTLVGGG